MVQDSPGYGPAAYNGVQNPVTEVAGDRVHIIGAHGMARIVIGVAVVDRAQTEGAELIANAHRGESVERLQAGVRAGIQRMAPVVIELARKLMANVPFERGDQSVVIGVANVVQFTNLAEPGVWRGGGQSQEALCRIRVDERILADFVMAVLSPGSSGI